MKLINWLCLLLVSSVMAGCAVSTDPREQGTLERIYASATGLDEKTLIQMQEKLDALDVRAQGIEESIDYYKAQLYLTKKELDKYSLPQKELDKLRADIESLSAQTQQLEAKNVESVAMIEKRKMQVAQKEGEREALIAGIQDIQSQMGVVEEENSIVSNGIERIAELRARQALEE
ncbi:MULTISPECIES: hypothetical protein [Alteromonas]|jgi:chromosome segregation ATPase|uniref:hypothetical protein n=1 Tax=Alteromonas TaxID=226 RepID=UPI001930C004|nr:MULTISPECIES: hypothetical protein [Alteromonas]